MSRECGNNIHCEKAESTLYLYWSEAKAQLIYQVYWTDLRSKQNEGCGTIALEFLIILIIIVVIVIIQRRISKPVKHLRWLFFVKIGSG